MQIKSSLAINGSLALPGLFALLLISFASCKTQKSATANSSFSTDSVASSAAHRTIITDDSLWRSLSFAFDTLDVQIERPTRIDGTQEIIRLKAVGARVNDQQSAKSKTVDDSSWRNTGFYKEYANASSTEHSDTTRVYKPPNGTIIGIIAILAIAMGLFIFFMWRRIKQ